MCIPLGQCSVFGALLCNWNFLHLRQYACRSGFLGTGPLSFRGGGGVGNCHFGYVPLGVWENCRAQLGTIQGGVFLPCLTTLLLTLCLKLTSLPIRKAEWVPALRFAGVKYYFSGVSSSGLNQQAPFWRDHMCILLERPLWCTHADVH